MTFYYLRRGEFPAKDQIAQRSFEPKPVKSDSYTRKAFIKAVYLTREKKCRMVPDHMPNLSDISTWISIPQSRSKYTIYSKL